jgi:hypothetical protein
MHVLVITGADFQVTGVGFDPLDLAQKFVTLGHEAIALDLHVLKFRTLGILLCQWLPIYGHHDRHHQKQETEFPDSHDPPQAAFNALRPFMLNLDFLILHSDAESRGVVN